MPGLYVYRSNLVETLSSFLAGNLQAAPLSDPLATEHIVVGSRGMEQWLRRRLSEEVGVCANVTFPFPMAHLGKALDTLTTEPGAAIPAISPWSPDALMWAIVQCLPELIDKPEFEPLRSYLGANNPDGSSFTPELIGRKQISLARQIADIFDRYIAYRPEWAVAWSAGKTAPNLTFEDGNPCTWQPILWKAAADILGKEQSHIATRLEEFNPATIEDAPARLGYERLSIFGVSTLPRSYLNILTGLSQLIDVHLYVLCPSDQYWGDIGKAHSTASTEALTDRQTWSDYLREERVPTNSHPLLVSLGRVARDFQTQLLELPDSFDDQTGVQDTEYYFDPAHIEASLAAEPSGARSGSRVVPSALSTLQSDIFNLKSPQTMRPGRTLHAADDSIQVHACHGATRQVEVLRENLLHLLERHPHIQPRDILVMTPKIEIYAPLITAIFDEGREASLKRDGWGPVGGPKLPYRIADLSVRRLNPIADTLMRALEMAAGRVEASTMLDFLAQEPPQLRFGIEPEELPQIQRWLEEAGICWGIDAEHRSEHHAQPSDISNTWQFGLERLAVGVTMADEGQLLSTLFDHPDAPEHKRGIIPFDSMEGQSTRLLGKLMECCSSLFSQIDNLRKPRPVAEWAAQLRTTIEALTATTRESAFLTRRVIRVIDEMEQAAGFVDCEIPITLDALTSYLNGRFEIAQGSTHNSGGAITFCAMLPMRCIPYKVVVLLGMDDGSFPRNPTTPRFDLTTRPRRIGDRDPRDDDRLLLLEGIQSAREHLLIYYTGRNEKNNEAQEPAGPIAELLDTIDQSFEFPAGKAGTRTDALTTHHPLQAFNPSNFDKTPGRHAGDLPSAWSFDKRKLDAALCLQEDKEAVRPFFEPVEETEHEAQEDVVVHLGDLIRFIQQPVVHYFKEELGLTYSDTQDLIADREPIAMDGLSKWQMANSLLSLALGEGAINRTDALLRARAGGTLPLGTPGRIILDERTEVIEKGTELFQNATAGKELREPLNIDLTLPGKLRLIGQVPGRWNNTAIFVDTGKESAKRLITPWMHHLAWTAQHPEDNATTRLLLCAREKDGSVYAEHLRFELAGDVQERQEEARQELAQLIQWYLRGKERPIRFLQKTSYAFAEVARESLTASQFAQGPASGLTDDQYQTLTQARRSAGKAWESNQNFSGEGADYHLARTFEEAAPYVLVQDDGSETVHPEFAWYALRFWGPLLNARHEEV